MKLSMDLLPVLRCPSSGHPLRACDAEMVCDASPAHRYPIVAGVPILVDDESSIFRVSEIAAAALARESQTDMEPAGMPRRLRRWVESALPRTPESGVSAKNLAAFAREVSLLAAHPRVLIVGGGEGGAGFGSLERWADRISLIETDVRVTARTHVVCDAHRLPFADSSLHGVVIQAVLEHVLDPHACVREIHRVLVPDGVVYAETPFMQQVHMGRHDFTRFTYLGHRRLFRWFELLDAGAVCGPGAAIRWSLEYYVRSVTSSRNLRWFGAVASRVVSWPIESMDSRIMREKKSWDAASALFLLGRKATTPLPDDALLASYPA
jgi:SAM-dependent methyltransferase/uncharacterized protein YbaR (Trm112 family)